MMNKYLGLLTLLLVFYSLGCSETELEFELREKQKIQWFESNYELLEQLADEILNHYSKSQHSYVQIGYEETYGRQLNWKKYEPVLKAGGVSLVSIMVSGHSWRRVMFIIKDDIDKIKLRNIKFIFNVNEFNRELLTENSNEIKQLRGGWYIHTTTNN